MPDSQAELGAPSSAPTIYSTYICREPVGDVGLLINNGPDEYTSLLRTLQRSADHWAEKDHTRTVERIQLEIARLHMQHKQWQRAMRTLVPLWQTLTWRQAGWWSLLEEVDWALVECAKSVRDAEIMVAVKWELMHRSLTKRQGNRVDVRSALENLEGAHARPRAVIRQENILSCVSVTFAFSQSEGNVGVPLESQLVLSSQAHADSAPVDISQIRIAFEGGLKNISFHHQPEESVEEALAPRLVNFQRTSLQHSSIESESTPTSPAFTPSHTLSASADLTLAAGETKVIAFSQLPRDDGDLEVSTITVYVKEPDFDLEVVISEDKQMHQDSLWVLGPSGMTQKLLKAERSSSVKILPKPPKMRLALPDILTAYYVDEDAVLDLEVTNEEDESAKGTLDVRILGPPGMHARIAWVSESEGDGPLEEAELEAVREDGHARLPTKQIAGLGTGTRQKHQIHIWAATKPAEYSVRMEARYSLLSDPETPISKSASADIGFIQPFEATFNFAPRFHSDPWPNYFDIEDAEDSGRDGEGVEASGLSQRWSLVSRLTSLATDVLIIESVSPKIDHMTPPSTAMCRIFQSNSSATASSNSSSHHTTSLDPGALQSHIHTIDVQKLDLDLEDRNPFSIQMHLQIKYRRRSSPSQHTTVTALTTIPPLSLPFSEPRCLAWTPHLPPPAGQSIPRSIPLTYTLENPSSYTLTFSLSMDNNEAFAFSGPKSLTVQLLPLSRRAVEYQLLPLGASEQSSQQGGEDGGGCWIWPHLVVVDTGFRKTLRVLPAGEGLRSGRRGEVGVWAGD